MIRFVMWAFFGKITVALFRKVCWIDLTDHQLSSSYRCLGRDQVCRADTTSLSSFLIFANVPIETFFFALNFLKQL